MGPAGHFPEPTYPGLLWVTKRHSHGRGCCCSGGLSHPAVSSSTCCFPGQRMKSEGPEISSGLQTGFKFYSVCSKTNLNPSVKFAKQGHSHRFSWAPGQALMPLRQTGHVLPSVPQASPCLVQLTLGSGSPVTAAPVSYNGEELEAIHGRLLHIGVSLGMGTPPPHTEPLS